MLDLSIETLRMDFHSVERPCFVTDLRRNL